MDLLLNNLKLLKELDIDTAARIHGAEVPPQAEIWKTAGDDWALAISGLSFHSRVNPMAEAEARAEAPDVKALREKGGTPAVYGFGLGYHVLALAKRFDKVLVIEPDAGMIRLAFGLLDFTEVLPKLVFLWPNSNPDLYAGAEIVTHAPSAKLHPVELDWWKNRLARENSADKIGALSASTLSKLWRGIEGLDEFLVKLPEYPGEEDIIEAARQGRGPLTELDIYLLLVSETTCSTGRFMPKEAS